MKKKQLEQRIAHLMDVWGETTAKALPERLTKLEAQVYCGITTGHQHLTLVRKQTYCFVFRCINCDLEYVKDVDSITEKEAKLVAVVFPEQEKEKK